MPIQPTKLYFSQSNTKLKLECVALLNDDQYDKCLMIIQNIPNGEVKSDVGREVKLHLTLKFRVVDAKEIGTICGV